MTAVAWTPCLKPTDARLIDLAGSRYGALVVSGFAGRDARTKHIWRCRCDCGAETFARADHLRAGKVRSCGCVRDALAGTHTLTHGATAGRHRTAEYRAWKGMRERCEAPSSSSYARYGGRGIKVCARWSAFPNFLADMGPRPSPHHSIDRTDNDGDYEPGNCTWATRQEQARNRRNNRFIVVAGERLTIAEAAGRLGLQGFTLIARLERGWSVERATTTPLITHQKDAA